MNKILKRDDFISEVYNPMMEQKEYEELVSINEGLLKNLFGMVKNMFKKDWETIKGDPQIIKIYKEMDDKLTGFSIMKMSKKDKCNQIRQVLVDFACDWYDFKMNRAKEKDSDPVPSKSMKFKDETLRENLSNCEKKINDIAKDDEQMKKWADALLRDMKDVINRSILDDIDDEEKKKQLQEEIDNNAKKQEELNKEMEKWQKNQLEQIKKERETIISSFDATPESDNTTGNKEVAKLYSLFKDDSKEKFIETVANDKLLGFNSIFKKSNGSKGISIGDKSYNILNAVYKKMNDDAKLFSETPAQSVQAMCIAINNFVKLCNSKNMNVKSIQLELMAKCAILSNGAISYNLPLNGKDGDDAGNYFTDTIANILGDEFKNSNNEVIKASENFKTNARNLFKDIKDKAVKIKEDAEKKYNDELKSLKSNEKKES